MTHNSFISNMPKIDLHCHLDGSFSPEFIRKALKLPAIDDQLITKLKAPADCSSLTQYLTCFDLPISAIQTKENIINGVLDVLSQASSENVKYMEIRFAPTCSVNENLSLTDIYEAAIAGTKLGLEKYGIYSNIILCAMRHHQPDTNLKVLESMADYVGHGICGLDIAGDESQFPNQLFQELFSKAKDMGIPFTIHSGECGSTENVKLACQYGAKRIGHGIALIHDINLMQDIKSAGIGLELCPTSNFQTRAWSDMSTYPLRDFLDYGLLGTINTDNRTVSNTNMTTELTLAESKLNIREEDLLTIYKNSVEISFADDNIKHKLLTDGNSSLLPT